MITNSVLETDIRDPVLTIVFSAHCYCFGLHDTCFYCFPILHRVQCTLAKTGYLKEVITVRVIDSLNMGQRALADIHDLYDCNDASSSHFLEFSN